ncbi:selenocysteine-specific translation elongation factor [Pseudonocardia acidicola]|uniref:Selenocysteine-specific elongation factor n=1 Tax=Pseudonocardia acidicola TaxID=2724939 RepID=A0ABX1SDE5_9PSEU|nr:selenocysteine-specific translation elongation factor [Pseudonocardia acidicola]NMH99596.1 selenocysteine-specific translation elongation factor [Pseudonocardia acidicola]
MQVIATAGHVDHGKSTLVRALTGMEPDRWAEERRRGMTIDLGFAWTTLPGGATVAFVDVPGHERFVTTMLAGVGPVPAVLLVVAADEGWMPQSAEHLDALEALGVRHGLLVVTRSDLLDPELARDEACEHLAGTTLGGLPAVCVSATTGAGMDELRAALDELAAGLPTPDPAADVRLWVDRAFTIRGAGTVVTGTLAAGRIRTDDELELASADGSDRRVTVRALQSLGQPADEVRGVARVAVNLRGLPREAVARGDLLLTPGAWLGTDLLDVRLHGVRGDTPDPATLPEELTFHVGSAAVAARVRPLGQDTVRLRLRHRLPLRIGDRAVLRDPGRRQVTAGVTVLDVRPPELRRRGAAAGRATELAGMGDTPDAAGELTRRGVARRAELIAMGVPARAVDRLAQSGYPAAAGWIVAPERATELAAQLTAAVAEHDAADPLDPGLPIEAARRAVGLPEARLVEAVLRHVPGELVLRDGRVTRSAAAGLPATVLDALQELRADLRRDPFAAPEAARLAELRLGPKQLASLVRAGELLRVADGIVLLPGADDRAVEVLAGLGPEFTLSSARQALKTTRRVAVPLLELLARTGRTTRTPDGGHRLV